MAQILSIETKSDAVQYLDAADLSSLLKRELRAAFPGVTFSVRCRKYSMGSSVDIHWTDGPITADVDAVVAPFDCQGFDGMTDSTTNRGPVQLADGRIVRITSYIHTSRTVSETLHARAAAWIARHMDAVNGWELEQEIHRLSWRSMLVNGALVVRKGVR